MKFKTVVDQLRFLALAEGISFLLFALTMPMKYVWGMTTPNKVVGMAHGVLFIAYIAWVLVVSLDQKWHVKTTFLAGIASIIPGGTFIADAKIFKKINS